MSALNFSEDDRVYIRNASYNGIENYPFIVLAGTSPRETSYEPTYANNGMINMVSIGSDGKITTYQGTFASTTATAFQSLRDVSGNVADLQTNLSAAQAPSGVANNTIGNEFKAIKNNYATKAELPEDELPAISSGDAGKVLKVNSGATGVEWVTESSSPIPACPTTEDSTFQLQCVVSGGVATYSWVDIIPHPILTNFWLGLNDTEIIGTGDLQGDVDPDNKYVFTWDGTLSQAISDQAEYSKSIEVECGEYQGGDSGNCMFSWDSEEDCWVFSDGPSTISIIPEGGVASATSCEVIVVFDPNWEPLTAPDILNIVITDSNEVNIVDTAQGGASYEHPVVPISGEIGQDGKYHYTLGTADNTLIVDGNDFATANNPYSFVLTLPEGNRGASDASLTSSADPDWDYTLEGGPDKFFFKAVGDCEYVAELVFDPNWTPSEQQLINNLIIITGQESIITFPQFSKVNRGLVKTKTLIQRAMKNQNSGRK